jgi:predicted nuclease of predicted toxin-antitoxin system
MAAVWVDAQLSPELAVWFRESLGVEAMRDLGLRDAEDLVIFDRARSARAIVLTKDSDFVDLVTRRGPPPQIVWLTCGNTSNTNLHDILSVAWPRTAALLASNEPLIEIGGKAC